MISVRLVILLILARLWESLAKFKNLEFSFKCINRILTPQNLNTKINLIQDGELHKKFRCFYFYDKSSLKFIAFCKCKYYVDIPNINWIPYRGYHAGYNLWSNNKWRKSATRLIGNIVDYCMGSEKPNPRRDDHDRGILFRKRNKKIKNKCKPWGVWVVGVMSENNEL